MTKRDVDWCKKKGPNSPNTIEGMTEIRNNITDSLYNEFVCVVVCKDKFFFYNSNEVGEKEIWTRTMNQLKKKRAV